MVKESSLNALKKALIVKGVPTDESYFIYYDHDEGLITVSYNVVEDKVYFIANVSSSETLIGLTLEDGKLPTALCSVNSTPLLSGTHNHSRLSVSYCPYPSLKPQAISLIESAYSIFDSLLLINGIDISLSDLGIYY